MSKRDISGLTVVITGAARGIGEATAELLTSQGATVALGDLDTALVRQVAERVGRGAVGAHLDVTSAESWQSFLAEVGEVGPIDVLVNNAGGDQIALFTDTDEAMWDRALALNLRSTIACTHAALPGMLERRRGAIVNVASEAGRMGTAGGALYSAAKAGVIGFTKAIAREAATRGVRCNAVAPGPIDTPLLNGAAETAGVLGARIREKMIAATLVSRAGRPEEVAAAIAYLGSDDSSFVTGETIAVSGGISMW